MIDNYYTLLGLERGLPHWRFAPKVYEMAEEAMSVYGSMDAVPDVLLTAITTLGTEEDRNRYDSLLKWAEAGTELDPGALGDDAIHHFAVERLKNGNVKLLLEAIAPPPPPAPRESQPQQPQQEAQAARQQAPPSPKPPPARDVAGRINGKIPPLQYGNKTFTVSSAPLRLIHAQVITEKRPMKRVWVKLLWQKGDGTQFGDNEYLGWNTQPDFWVPGQTYTGLWLQETVTKEWFLCCYCYENPQGTMLSIFHTFRGLFHRFPFEIEYRKFERLYPGYHLAHDYFGTGGIGTEQTMEIAVKYLRDTGYWVIQEKFGLYVPEEAKNLANYATKDSIRAWPYKPRALRRLGVPV